MHVSIFGVVVCSVLRGRILVPVADLPVHEGPPLAAQPGAQRGAGPAPAVGQRTVDLAVQVPGPGGQGRGDQGPPQR